jgi:hypothetical protein
MSTHRKIDARNSYWAGPTFGSMVADVLSTPDVDQALASLPFPKTWCVTTLLSHPSHTMIYNNTGKGQLLMVTIFDSTTGHFLDLSAAQTHISAYSSSSAAFVMPQPVTVADNLELTELLAQMHAARNFDSVGLIVLRHLDPPNPVKVIGRDYTAIRDIRGNDAKLRSRYLRLRNTPEGTILQNWFNTPQHLETFAAAEREVQQLAAHLFELYTNQYVRKVRTELPKEEYVAIKRCHQVYLSDRKNKTTIDAVLKTINETPNHFVLIMLNRRRDEARAAQRAAGANASTTTTTTAN